MLPLVLDRELPVSELDAFWGPALAALKHTAEQP
jgi:hypothetical protein